MFLGDETAPEGSSEGKIVVFTFVSKTPKILKFLVTLQRWLKRWALSKPQSLDLWLISCSNLTYNCFLGVPPMRSYRTHIVFSLLVASKTYKKTWSSQKKQYINLIFHFNSSEYKISKTCLLIHMYLQFYTTIDTYSLHLINTRKKTFFVRKCSLEDIFEMYIRKTNRKLNCHQSKKNAFFSFILPFSVWSNMLCEISKKMSPRFYSSSFCGFTLNFHSFSFMY